MARRLQKLFLALSLPLGAAALLAADPARITARAADEIDWKASGSLPPGAEYHLVYEEKATRGVQTLARFSRGYVLPLHSHSHDEVLFVLKGKILLSSEGQETLMRAGGYAVIPAGMAHALQAKSACEIMATLPGPYDLKLQSTKRAASTNP